MKQALLNDLPDADKETIDRLIEGFQNSVDVDFPVHPNLLLGAVQIFMGELIEKMTIKGSRFLVAECLFDNIREYLEKCESDAHSEL